MIVDSDLQRLITLERENDRLADENERLKREKSRLEEKLKAALDGTGICLWEQHIPTGKLTIFNMEWGKMLGFSASELDATVDIWKSKLHPDDYLDVVANLQAHLNGQSESYQVVHRMLHKNGSHSWVSDRGRIVEYDDQGCPLRMMGTHIDITQEKRYELELAKRAHSDPLTNLLNRNAFKQIFANLATQMKNHDGALVFIDLDNFKCVNDRLGHKAGDSVLLEVANWLQSDAPPKAKIARLGGDEFMFLCIDVCQADLIRSVECLLSRVQLPIRLENGEVTIGLSIGICQFVLGDANFDMAYEKADHAMYQVKHHGKNNFHLVRM
ncbi:GGDEF domain-containing protein [Celerinatantimonas yamalensis]